MEDCLARLSRIAFNKLSISRTFPNNNKLAGKGTRREVAMEIQPLEMIIAELESNDWLKAGSAIRKLIPHGEAATAALYPLFELTLHAKAPLVSDSSALIKRLGKHAVPFLREQVINKCPRHRAMALALLTETGCRRATSVRLIDQLLDSRREELPEWGCAPDEIIALFKAALEDESLAVRFTAACALEEFGRYLSETVPVFIEVLQSGTSHQQNWAALQLGRIGAMAVAATDALVMAAESQRQYVSLAVANALKQIRYTDQAS
jgi:HEAT repeat protein